MNLSYRMTFFSLLLLLAGLLFSSGCLKKVQDTEAEIKEALLEQRSDFLTPHDSLRWLGHLSAAPQDTARAWLMLGVLYLANDQPQPALEYFRLAEKQDPTRPVVQLNMADAYNRMRQYDLATERFHEFLNRNPESQFAPEIFRIIQKYRSIESENLIPAPDR